MNYLFIHCTSDLYGASQMLIRIINRLINDGNKVNVVLPTDGLLVNELKNIGANVSIVRAEPTIRKSYFKSPIKFLRFVYDVIYSFFLIRKIAKKNYSNVIITNTSQTIVGGFIAKNLKIPHACHVRESYSDYGKMWFMYELFLLYFSDLIICTSKSMMNQFNSKNHNKKVFVVYDGISISDVGDVNEEKINKFKKDFNLIGYKVVGLIGRIIIHRKGQETFVKAASEVIKKFENVKFLIVGDCYPGNEHHKEKLVSLINKFNLNDVVILTGQIYDINCVHSSIDISVMASGRPEPFGLVTVEAMANKKPVIGTNIGGTIEIIDNNHTGILIPPNDPFSMADAILNLLENEDLRNQMGKNGYLRFLEKFEFEPCYNNLIKLYNSISE